MIEAILLVGAVVLCVLAVIILGVVAIVLAVRRRVRMAKMVGGLSLLLGLCGAVCGVVLAWKAVRFVASPFAPRSGEELFAVFVLEDVPESVTFVHSREDEGFVDAAYWLHFRIDPADVPRVLAARPYAKKSLDGSSVPHDAPEWMDLDRLGPGVEVYEATRQNPHHPDIIDESSTLLINAEHTEAYFLHISY